MISDPLVWDLSEVVLIHLFMTATKTDTKSFFRSKVALIQEWSESCLYVIIPHLLSLIGSQPPSHGGGGRTRGLSVRTCEEETMAREHSD